MTNIQNELWAIAGMQNADLETIVEVGSELPLNPDQVESKQIEEELVNTNEEVVELANQTEELAVKVQEQEEIIEKIQENLDGLESMFSSYQYSQSMASLVYGQTLELHAKLGGNNEGSVLGAEAFSDATTAQLAMQTGLEAVGETIKKYAKASVEFIKKIWAYLVNFVKALFDKSFRLSNLSKSYRKRLNAGESLKNTINIGKYNKFFCFDKDGNNGGEKDAFKDISAKTEKATATLATEIMNLFDSVGIDGKEFIAKVKQIRDGYLTKIKSLGTAETKGDITSVKVGSKTIVAILTVYSGKIETVKEAKKFFKSIALKVTYPKGDFYKGEIKTKYGKSDLITYLDGVDELVEFVSAFKKGKAGAESEIKAKINKIAGEADKGTEGVDDNVSIAKTASTALLGIVKSNLPFVLDCAQAALAVVNAHFGKASTEDKPKEETKALENKS